MRKISLVILTSLIVLALAACNSAPAPGSRGDWRSTPAAPSAAFATERAALQAGDTATAIASLEKAVGTTPGSAEAHLLLAQAYFRAQRKDEATQQFMAGLSLDPKAALPLETKDADELLQVGNAHASLTNSTRRWRSIRRCCRSSPIKPPPIPTSAWCTINRAASTMP